MAFVPIQYLVASTTSFTSTGATAITTDSTTTALLLSLLGPSSNGNYTTINITDGVNLEIMFILGVDAGAVTVERAQEGTTAVPLAQGATFRFVWTETSILAIAPGGTVTLTGSGAAAVTGGPAYNVNVPLITLNAGTGIGVSGGPSTYTISNLAPAGATGATGPAGPSTVVTASGIASASTISGGYNVAVSSPAFVAGSGLSISGTWPNITFTNTQTQGGTGTVTNLVAGTGITISGGTPTINPTVSITPTGVTPGTYGGIQVNAGGQITAIASGFVTNISTSTTGMTIATPTVGNYTVNVASATTGGQGLVQLAAATSGGSNDPSDATKAVSPAGVNAVINSLSFNPASFSVAGSQSALSSGSYTTAISGMPIPIAVASGKSALIDIYVEVWDPSNPTVTPTFAIGLFNGASLLAGVGNVPGFIRNLKYLVVGPLTTTLGVSTTTLTGTNTLGSYYATITQN